MASGLRPKVIPMSDSSAGIRPEDVVPTALPDAFLESEAIEAVASYHMPRYDELPCVSLYRDQVLGYIDRALSPLDPLTEGPWLSPSMVNNYVKSGLIAAPDRKLYGTEQIAKLLIICIFKQVLSMEAIAKLFRIQSMTYTTRVAYDYAATELEGALRAAFSSEREVSPDSATHVTRESLLVRNAVSAFAARAMLVSYLRFAGYPNVGN